MKAKDLLTGQIFRYTFPTVGNSCWLMRTRCTAVTIEPRALRGVVVTEKVWHENLHVEVETSEDWPS